MDPRRHISHGNQRRESFLNERPAHLVQVQGFWIDKQDVTNAEFSEFVEATGYITTAERRIDWEDLKKELPPGTLKPDEGLLQLEPLSLLRPRDQFRSMICRPGGVGCTEQTGAIPKALKAPSREEKTIRSSRSRGTTRWPMRSGRASDCLPKPSGNSRPAAAWKPSAMSGVTNSSRAANTWQTPGREYFPFETVAKMALSALRPWPPFPPMGTAYTTWLVTSGNGAATGIGPIATWRLPAKMFVAIPVDRRRVMILAIHTLPSVWSKAAHFFATRTTARATDPARDEERRLIPVHPIQVFGAFFLKKIRKLAARLAATLLSQNRRLLTQTPAPNINEI